MDYRGKFKIAVVTLILGLETQIKKCSNQRGKTFHAVRSVELWSTIIDDFDDQGHLKVIDDL